MKLKRKKHEVFIVLHNVRSVYNVGSIFRTADCLGVQNIILVGFTPTPIDRFGHPRKDFAKVSLGAEKMIFWRHCRNFGEASRYLKSRKVKLVALEQAPAARDYKKIKPHYPAAFIFGNELSGLPERILKQCDVVAEIPIQGKKESLNVSVAVGIALSCILNI